MVTEKNFTVVKCAVKNEELIEYFTQTALLSNNLTNVNLYHKDNGSSIHKTYIMNKTRKKILNHINMIVN